MFVQQLYTKCLSEAAYFIADNGEAAVIDPMRDIDSYLELAKEHNATIKYIFETHFHADFVSGHLDLAKATGATIVYGPNTNAAFEFHKATDNEVFKIGNVTITALHTPGHTLESTCFLLKDENGKDYSIFTGDTLFVGDVGRPDLSSGNMSKDDLATLMYNSLNTKIKTLEDHVIVYPAHGPGSSCGKALGAETFSTIGTQKATNYALQEMTQEDFVKAVTEGLNTPPAYFPINAQINARGYESLNDVLTKALTKMSTDEVATYTTNHEVVILDTRSVEQFTIGFVPGSISIGLDGRFAEWAGSLLSFETPIILVTEQGKEQESAIRLSRVGLDNVIGYLEGGFEAWVASGKEYDMIIDIEADELAMDMKFDEKLQVIDVRKEAEYDNGHIDTAENLPLHWLSDPLKLANLDEDGNLYVHCAGGYRSVIACSIMKREGFSNVRNVLKGYAAIKDTEGFNLVAEAKTLN